jgi:hypothetical protein
MKTKLFFTFLLISMVFYSCNEEPSLPKPKKTNENNLMVKFDNIPEEAKGKQGVIMVYKGEDLYLTKSFALVEQNEVKAYLPEKEMYNIKAFIKNENETWAPDDEDNSGWYSSIGNVAVTQENPQINLMTLSWSYCETAENCSAGNMIDIVTCTITNPKATTSPYNPNDIIAVKISASDNGHTNISEVTLSLDGNKIATMSEPSYYHDINTKDLGEGKHTIKATAKNANGITATDEVDIYIEPAALGEAPEINNFSVPAEITQGDSTTISARIYDPDGEIKNAELYIDDQKFTFTDTLGSTYSRKWYTTDYQAGTYEIKVKAIDDDDNERTKRENIEITEQ